ncbi:hypothetical protein [Legionella sp. W05-934-2]|uniref:hypothetical protein n=1 Tax=Legionella sp. W05-934-2 TaxID=1198649 RepID=UPI003462E011
MKKFFLYLIAVFFPWVAMLLSDNPAGAVVALVMQVTVIGWPFAAHMAIGSVREYYEFDAKRKSKSSQEQNSQSQSESESE